MTRLLEPANQITSWNQSRGIFRAECSSTTRTSAWLRRSRLSIDYNGAEVKPGSRGCAPRLPELAHPIAGDCSLGSSRASAVHSFLKARSSISQRHGLRGFIPDRNQFSRSAEVPVSPGPHVDSHSIAPTTSARRLPTVVDRSFWGAPAAFPATLPDRADWDQSARSWTTLLNPRHPRSAARSAIRVEDLRVALTNCRPVS
jgi:hypothetical protein